MGEGVQGGRKWLSAGVVGPGGSGGGERNGWVLMNQMRPYNCL